ncbi:SGNH/GDSL hydrolase family protein [Pseudomonas berkeleyensis]|uniref:SGNH/GDSL hydrolase family protein n=1 Tax=Pseudomonas berkeleyensis TaxID=2726956 RepID=A0A7G5DKJ5_9PSED|nr:SGNH/GDSL hydrolase family protein [Pseudomonas berkeleyensis]QMV62270.1 SGNH/GDSL hydrolase family protein [Pseudomonas berkeleyensis]WSO37713.1 SGNH/GDSL hydrolase family protein [Pseudomonas berkeleyensis]
MRHALWWLATLALAPLAVPLALRTRRTALRLPPAEGEVRGLAGAALPGEPFRLLLVGESTVAGVGVKHLDEALVACLAEALAERMQRPVHWHACGENGITAERARQRLLPEALSESADLALLVFGVNDTTHLTTCKRWQTALRGMAVALREQGMVVAFSAVPPLQHFRALPWLLRQLLGWRASLLDRELRAVAREQQAQYCELGLAFEAHYLAEDGYHPSALGYRVWAQGLAEHLARAC